MDYDIDIVVIWVDGSDPQWQKEFLKYSKEASNENDIQDIRYRDWGLMRYWFRGIEKFCPWARKIHFVTCGQKPEWLNLNNPKLNWVKHEDFMPKDCLPTFNSDAIEINLHRIPGLAERFVYFNDDIFVIRPVNKTSFFRDGLLCGEPLCDIPHPAFFSHILLSNLILLEKHFNKHKVIKQNLNKWFNYRYGHFMWKNLLLWRWNQFSGFYNFHIASPLTKSIMEDVWHHCPKELKETSESRLRSCLNINQYLFTYWAYATGKFAPSSFHKIGEYKVLSPQTMEEICSIICQQSTGVLCINDTENALNLNFESTRHKLQESFNSILPHKSTFEL